MPVRFKKRRIVLAAHDFCQIISPGQRVDTGLKRCDDINWDILWEQAIKEKSWPAKSAADWNERAASFARRTEQSPYTETFLSKLNTQPSWSVLDLGSALRRLNAFAIHKVVVTDRVGHGPFDPDAYAAVGHPLRLGPDY